MLRWTNELKRKLPIKSGELRRNIKLKVETATEELIVVRLTLNTNYAEYIEFGSGIYSQHPQIKKDYIRPRYPHAYKNKKGVAEIRLPKALHWKLGSNDVFAKFVRGMRPRFIITRMLERLPEYFKG